MASKRNLKRRSCVGKTRFSSQTEAVKAAITLEKTRGEHVSSYGCRFCNGWHIGHQIQKYRRA